MKSLQCLSYWIFSPRGIFGISHMQSEKYIILEKKHISFFCESTKTVFRCSTNDIKKRRKFSSQRKTHQEQLLPKEMFWHYNTTILNTYYKQYTVHTRKSSGKIETEKKGFYLTKSKNEVTGNVPTLTNGW